MNRLAGSGGIVVARDNQERIVAALRRIIRAVDLHSQSLAQRYGLTGPQLLVLQYLERHGAQTTGQLAQGVSVGQATLSGMLERLEAKKLVRRRRSKDDRRRIINELTKKGEGVLVAAPPPLQERFVEQLERLEDWEQTLLLSSLQRVATMMHAEEIDASPLLVTGPISVSAQETADFLTPPAAKDEKSSRKR